MGRHGLYSGHYSGVFVAPENAQNTETKHQSGAVPILLLVVLASMTSAYSSLVILQGWNPQRQLLKESVYHSATSAVYILAYNSARKKILEEGTLWRKYKSELNDVRKFSLKFPGIGNLLNLPSSTAQLQEMKHPLIIKLWKEKYPDVTGVDYNDNISVWANIPEGWWLNHEVCKYILSCLVHKENKNITTKPTMQPPGHTCIEARGRKEKALEGERAAANADCPVEKYGDVDHQIKKI